MSSEYFVVLGSRGFRLFADEFRGEPKIHIRKQFKDQQTGRVFPIEQEILLSLQEWEQLLVNQGQIRAELDRLSHLASQKKKENRHNTVVTKNEQKRCYPYPRKAQICASQRQGRRPTEQQIIQHYRENKDKTTYDVPQVFF